MCVYCSPLPMGKIIVNLAGSISSVRYPSDWYSGRYRFSPLVRQHSFMEIGHEINSTAILSLPLIQVGQLSVITGKRMCTKYWWMLRSKRCGLSDCLSMTIVVDWNVKQQNKTNNKWASSWDHGTYHIGNQRRLKWASAVSPEPSLFAHMK